MGVGHRLTHVHKPPQQFPEGQTALARVAAGLLCLVEAADGLFEVVPLHEAHGVEGATVGVLAQPVDRHDARVFQAAGNLGLQQEAAAAVRVVGPLPLDFLEGDLAVQFLVLGHEDLAQSPLGVGAEDLETGVRRQGIARPIRAAGFAQRSERESGLAARHKGAGGAGVGVRPGGRNVGQAGLHVGVGDLAQILPDRPEGADRRQTFLDVVAVQFQVPPDHDVQEVPVLGPEPLVLDQDLPEWGGLLQDPGIQGGDELVAADEVHLQGQDAEEQVTVGGRAGRVVVGHGQVLAWSSRSVPG
jgi:hypothetical protein